MQKFCFIKFSSQAPNPNTYSYTLQCLALEEGVLYGVGVVRSGWLRRGMHLEKYSSIRHDYYIFFLLTKFAENSQEVILKYLIKTFHASF